MYPGYKAELPTGGAFSETAASCGIPQELSGGDCLELEALESPRELSG